MRSPLFLLALLAVSRTVESLTLSTLPTETTDLVDAAGDKSSFAKSTVTKIASTRTFPRYAVSSLANTTRLFCTPEPTISNYYNVTVSSYEKFKLDPIIASVANAAPTPTGYYQSLTNHSGANSATEYFGYQVMPDGYDVSTCADVCTVMEGCISFNIYFERDPIIGPGPNCDNPTPFANIKCSFWGSVLDIRTANNTGQWRYNFHVAVAGSNAYTTVDSFVLPENYTTSLAHSAAKNSAAGKQFAPELVLPLTALAFTISLISFFS